MSEGFPFHAEEAKALIGKHVLFEQTVFEHDDETRFIAHRFQETTKALGVTLEYAGIQCPDDKPYIESFFGHYKTEEVHRAAYTTLAEGQVGWQLYRIWYETERVHESLGYQTPQRMVAQGAGPSSRRVVGSFEGAMHSTLSNGCS